MNKIGKLVIGGFIILFLSLYISRYNGTYYENQNLLTEQAIKQYEKDLREGKDITSINYLPEEKSYDNKASNIGRKLSSGIDKGFKSFFHYVMKYLDYLQNE